MVGMVVRMSGETGFYDSPEWQELRYRALQRGAGKCECCGRLPNECGPLHVDHIKPRSKYPHLELELTNLQVLCRDCNLGKSNRDDKDWRDKDKGAEVRLLLAGHIAEPRFHRGRYADALRLIADMLDAGVNEGELKLAGGDVRFRIERGEAK